MVSTPAKPHSLHDGQQRHALLVEYDGTEFSGSQYQSREGNEGKIILPTVQHALQEALAGLNLPVSSVKLSGRTDAGVHARGQVAHFDLIRDGLKNIPDLAAGLNALLPSTVRVKQAAYDIGLGFHSQKLASHRWYRYKLLNRPQQTLWTDRDTQWVRQPLDISAMQTAADFLTGSHDFTGFKSQGSVETHGICRVDVAQVVRQEGHEGKTVIFDIVANRFLYKMVRNLVGLLVLIGESHAAGESPVPVETVKQILEAGCRDSFRSNLNLAYGPAKARGLSLMAVRYPEPYNVFAADEYAVWLTRMLNQKPDQQNALTSPMESSEHENLFRKAS